VDDSDDNPPDLCVRSEASDDNSDDDDSTYYSADGIDLDVCGNPFDPSDHFFDAEDSIERLYAHSSDEFDDVTLNNNIFPKNRFRTSDSESHQLSAFKSSDGGGYGWITAMAALLQPTLDTPPLSRYIRSIHSGTRREISSMKRRIHYTGKHDVAEHQGSNEMDSHAHAYSDELEAIKDVQLGAGATLWTDPSSGSRYILEIHQALMFTDSLEHSLLNPNQIRYDGHSLCDDPWDKHRSLGLMCRERPIFIPFETRGTVICFDSRIPTVDELHTLPRLVLTADGLWDPATVSLRPFTENERERQSIVGNVRSTRVSSIILYVHLTPRDPLLARDAHISDIALASVSTALCDETLLPRLCASVRVAATGRQDASPVYTDERHSSVGPENLARLWNIGLEAARHTLKTTTQIGVRHTVRPLSRRYRTDTQMLHYRRLDTTFYSDTMFSKVKSLKGSVCAQVFVAENFIHVHPMGTNSDAGRALQVLAEDVGVPNHMVVDGAKEQMGPNTDFMKTVRWLKMRIRNTEPYSPWQNRAENSIGLLKKRWKQMIARKNVH
jgi:hypothetical protein